MLPTYSDYKDTFGDLAKIPENAFNLIRQRAEAEINRYTNIPVAEIEGSEICIMEVADFMHTILERDGVLSENTDGYSVSYGETTQTVYDIIKRYLSDYLYRGVDL